MDALGRDLSGMEETKKENRSWARTRYRDKSGNIIYLGDILHVEEYPDQYVGGSLDYDGVVEKDSRGIVVVTYYDIGESESTPLSHFKVRGRSLFSEEERKEYWKVQCLGEKPPEFLYRRELYTLPEGNRAQYFFSNPFEEYTLPTKNTLDSVSIMDTPPESEQNVSIMDTLPEGEQSASETDTAGGKSWTEEDQDIIR